MSDKPARPPMDWFPSEDVPRPDPRSAVRAAGAAAMPRRFWREAGARQEADGRFVLVLDGRLACTPARSPLSLPTRAAAEAVAAEWQAQGDHLDPPSMPMTRLVNSALDGVARLREQVVEETTRYGGSDLLCYRAGDPARLVEREAAAWDPLLAWARERLDARFVLAQGVMFTAQPESALQAVRAAVGAFDDPIALACLSTITSLTGSVVLALAVTHAERDAASAWAIAHVDEDFQMEVWGTDEEALERRARNFVQMAAAARLMALVRR